MEKVLIKQEPKNCDLIYESTLCCYLCEDGENILKALADHFKEKHFNGNKKSRKILLKLIIRDF